MIVIFSRGDDFSTRDVKNKLISMGQDVVVIEPMAAMEKFWGFCIIPWIKMLNYPSISTKLS